MFFFQNLASGRQVGDLSLGCCQDLGSGSQVGDLSSGCCQDSGSGRQHSVSVWNTHSARCAGRAVREYSGATPSPPSTHPHTPDIATLRCRGTSKQANEQTSKRATKQTSKQASYQTSKRANKQTSKQASKQANKQTSKQASKQANKQTSTNSIKHAKGNFFQFSARGTARAQPEEPPCATSSHRH